MKHLRYFLTSSKAPFRGLGASLLLLLFALTATAQSRDQHHFDVMKQLEIFSTAYTLLDQEYVDTLNAEKRIGDALNFLLYELDPYTEYYAEEAQDDLRQLTTGKYAGIGAVIGFSQKENRCYISAPTENMPAHRTGLRPGDILLTIDGKDLGTPADTSIVARNKYTSSVSSRLRGEPGTSFELRVRRPSSGKILLFKITREQISSPAVLVETMLTDTIGFLSLEQFTEGAAKEVRAAVIALKKKGARKIIFDLRDNPGGLINEAVDIVNLFVPRGRDVVSTKNKRKENDHTFRTTADPLDTEIPLVVLTNFGSASASEIVSGALQDLDRAVILGRRTYGKGLVQSSRDLPYNGALKFTTARYYIPSGRCVQAYEFKDGEPVHLPDSLAKEFKTAAGRSVRDGGGITPDVLITSTDTVPSMVSTLLGSEQLFDFCCRYRAQHSTIAQPEAFRLTDGEYEEMRQWVVENGFTYTRPTDYVINVLKTFAEREGLALQAAPELESLRQKFAVNLDSDFLHYRPQIQRLVEAEIVRQYYFARGVGRYLLRNDADVQAAVALLQDIERYKALLQPKK